MAEKRPWWERALAVSERRRVRALVGRVSRINDYEPEYEGMRDDELAGSYQRFRDRYENGESLDSILPEAFAAVREAGKRALGMRHFDVQMVGGMALHEGSVAEMLTGEGKTLVATLPLFLNAIPGHNVHLVTTNDYLAKRDSEWMRPVYEALGMNVGFLYNMQPQSEKHAAYSCNITYGTNSEFGFDYLRDNMAYSLDECMQRGHHFAIVDEADSILIDEARTPLIISGQPEEAAETYFQFARIVSRMKEGEHFEFDEKMHTAHPTEEGVDFAERELGIENLYLAENTQLINHLIQAIRARTLYRRDKEYVVVPGEDGEPEVKIVDEHTGRIMEGRRWSEGLHQAVEAKENVKPQEENVTVASITIQNYFRLYDKLAGMTGTASTEAAELKEIYNLDVVEVPPNRPVVRLDRDDRIYHTESGKFKAVVNDIEEKHRIGQPVLVGTIAVEKSEKLSAILTRKGIPHNVLNAKQHEKEAAIIKDAGKKGAVTIATNMAGRGIDIGLGEGVRELGGLYVLGTERHESRRIDNQLRGRSGRQGDPGETCFYLSTQDDLVRVFAGDRMERIMSRLYVDGDDIPLENKILSRQIKNAQKRVEERNFVIRKNVLKYDDVLNTQRHVVYEERQNVLRGTDLSQQVDAWVREEIELAVNNHAQSPYPDDWEAKELAIAAKMIYPVTLDLEALCADEHMTRETLIDLLHADAMKLYAAKQADVGEEILRGVERVIFLQVLDTRWREHLDNMDYLRDGIGLRGLAQKDPLGEYRAEGFEMFNEMQGAVRGEVVRYLMHVEIEPEDYRIEEPAAAVEEDPDANGSHVQDEAEATMQAIRNRAERRRMSGASTNTLQYSSAADGVATAMDEIAEAPVIVHQRSSEDKVGRNEPCPCGSGKKYKQCHGR